MGLDLRRSSVFGMVYAVTPEWDAMEEGLDMSLASFDVLPDARKAADDSATTSAGATASVFDERGERLTVEDCSVLPVERTLYTLVSPP